MVCEEALHRRMDSAAARRDIGNICTQELPLAEEETERLSEYAVPIRPDQLPKPQLNPPGGGGVAKGARVQGHRSQGHTHRPPGPGKGSGKVRHE